MNIGELIKTNRKAAKLTQQELANKIGISKNALWNYENNLRIPSIDIVFKICTVLNIGAGGLMGMMDMLNNSKELPKTNCNTEKEQIKNSLKYLFKNYLDKLILSTYGYEINLTDEQINNLMKISNNSLLPALELLNSK